MAQRSPFEPLLTGSRIQSRVPRRTLSTHPASIIQPVLVAPPRMSWPSDTLGDATPLLSPRYQASSLLRVAPPLGTVAVRSPSWYGPLVTFPVVATATPQYDRFPCATHAPALRSCHLDARHRLVGHRHPPDSSQDGSATLVSMSSSTISTRHQWFTGVHLRHAHHTQYGCAFPYRSRPWLFTTAADGSLKPPPVWRLRRACLHHMCSFHGAPDPDVRNARIRFLTQSCCCPRAVPWRAVLRVGERKVSPLSPASGRSARRSPSLPWVPWALLPHFPRYDAPLRLPPPPLRGLRVSLATPIPCVLPSFVVSPKGS